MGSSRNRYYNRPSRAQSVKSVHKSRRQPANPKPLLKLSPPTNAAQIIREMRNGIPTRALRDIRGRLVVAYATALCVHHTLVYQNAEQGPDAATVLDRHVVGAIQKVIDDIDALFKQHGVDEGDES